MKNSLAKGEDLKWASVGREKASPKARKKWDRGRMSAWQFYLLFVLAMVVQLIAIIAFDFLLHPGGRSMDMGRYEFIALSLGVTLMVYFAHNDKEAKRIRKRIAEVGGITDLAVLAEIAKDDEDEEVRQAATIHLLSLKVDELERAARGDEK
jgi:hypothetical protein